MNRSSLYKLASIVLILAVTVSGCSRNTVPDVTVPADPETMTLDSLKEEAPGIYVMDYYADYKLDQFLAANIMDVMSLDKWMTENLTHGVPTGDFPDFGCSSFAVKGSDGGHLFGRNYDMKPGDSLVIRTAPSDGYASIGVVDLMHINIGSDGSYSMDDENARTLLLAAPLCICDGINEKGLGASLLELSVKHSVTDTSNDDLLLYCAVRVVLDKCATVDEAVALLSGYDMYSSRSSTSYHVFLTDISGRSVIVEWNADGDMVTVEDTAVTNFPLYHGDTTKDYDHRYAKIHRRIDGADSMTYGEAMEVLEAAMQDSTHWSAVYDLEKFSAEIAFNCDYGKTYSFSGRMDP